MKKLYFSLVAFLYPFLCWSFELPSDWIQAQLPAPTVFAANQYKGDAIINSVNIFSLENQLSAVVGLKKKLKDNNLKDIGDGYLVKSYKPIPELKNSYQIEATNLRNNTSFTQLWKFSEKKAIVAQISNYSNISKEVKKEIFKMMGNL